jgi:hypothetical protein
MLIPKWFCCEESFPSQETRLCSSPQNKADIECYDQVMDTHPNYPKILYNFALGYKQRIKKVITIKLNIEK